MRSFPEDLLLKPRADLPAAETAVICQGGLFSQLSAHFPSPKVSKTLPGNVSLKTFDRVSLISELLGAPLAVINAESLLCSGVKRLVLLGPVGGLSYGGQSLEFGNLVFPRGALVEEGVSKHYGGGNVAEFSPGDLQNTFEAKLEDTLESGQIKRGLIWTTEVPFCETKAKAEEFAKRGAVAVDMEFSALLQLSKVYQAEFSAIFYISDVLSATWDAGFRSKEVKQAKSFLSEAMFSILS